MLFSVELRQFCYFSTRNSILFSPNLPNSVVSSGLAGARAPPPLSPSARPLPSPRFFSQTGLLTSRRILPDPVAFLAALVTGGDHPSMVPPSRRKPYSTPPQVSLASNLNLAAGLPKLALLALKLPPFVPPHSHGAAVSQSFP